MSPATSNTGQKPLCGDVLLVGHGHILRAFAMRWIGRELTQGVNLLLEGMLFPFLGDFHCSYASRKTAALDWPLSELERMTIGFVDGRKGRRR